MKKLLFLLPIFFSFYSCTSFKGFNQGNTPVNSLKQLEGTYKNTPKQTDKVKAYNAAADYLFYHIVDRKVLRKRYNPPPKKKHTFKLKVINDKKLLIAFFEDDKVVKRFKVKARVKDDGYIYLKNKNLKITFLLLVNGIHHKKTRLFINQSQNLVVDVASKNIGFVGFAPFGTGHFKNRYIFEKID